MKNSALCIMLALIAGIAAAQSPDLNAGLPLDPEVRTGTLDNGIRYFIRKNKKPENRMELRLAVNAGSVLEDDDQQGLAHFAEHMAFNGSQHFQKQELVNYLEGVGVRFGADLNAYTSFDETVYMLQLPTDTASILDKGFQVLEDWAHLVSYDNTEIDKERGVVIEEWRLRRGANARMSDKQFPIIFKGSKYAERVPIGKKDILESFSYDAVKRFYRDWYRPDLMAVIAVGDFDVAKIEEEIQSHFNLIPKATNPKPRPVFTVPDLPETRFAIATDPEATASSLEIMYKHPVQSVVTVGDYRTRIAQNLYDRMFNNRLQELSRQADPPFLYAYSAKRRYVRNAEFYTVGADVKNGGIARGMETLLTEARRVKQFGFTATELERERTALLRAADQRYDERDKTDSRAHIGKLVAHFLSNDPDLGAEGEHDLYKALVPGITIDEINNLATTLMQSQKQVFDKRTGAVTTAEFPIITVDAPEKAGVAVPSEQELREILTATSQKPVTAYIDRVVDQPLVSPVPAPQPILKEEPIPELGVTVWTLGNGARVVVKPTDFKNDEVMMTAFRPGGTSLASDADFQSASEATSIVNESGVGAFDATTLRKALSGKIAGVMPFSTETFDRLQGSASPKDLKTMFELLYLYFTAPRTDTAEFRSYIAKERGMLQNRSADPNAAFNDTLQVTLGQYHLRRQPFTEVSLDQINLTQAMEFYRSRYSDVNGFTFVFVGNIDLAALKPLVESYIGGLPTLYHADMWRDIGVHPPTGVIKKAVRKGIEPKSQVRIVFTGPFAWSAENRWRLGSLASVVSIKLREQLREEKGGVYGVSAQASPVHQPRDEYVLTVAFPCAPNRVEELTALALSIIDSVKQHGVPETYIHKIKEQQLRDRETAIKQNRFWLTSLQQYYQNGEDPRQLLKFSDMVNTLSSDIIRDAARTYFDTGNYVNVALFPEK